MLFGVPDITWMVSATLFWTMTGSRGGCVPGLGWIRLCGGRLRPKACSCTLGGGWRGVGRPSVPRPRLPLLWQMLLEVLAVWTVRSSRLLSALVALFWVAGLRAGAGAIGKVRATSVSWHRASAGRQPPVFTAASVVSVVTGRVGVMVRWGAAMVVPACIWDQLVRVGAVWLFPRTASSCFLLPAVLFRMLPPFLPRGLFVFLGWQLRFDWTWCFGGWDRRLPCRFIIFIHTQDGEVWGTYDLFCYLIQKGWELQLSLHKIRPGLFYRSLSDSFPFLSSRISFFGNSWRQHLHRLSLANVTMRILVLEDPFAGKLAGGHCSLGAPGHPQQDVFFTKSQAAVQTSCLVQRPVVHARCSGFFSSNITFITLHKAFFTSAVTSVKRRKTSLFPMFQARLCLATNTAFFTMFHCGENNGLATVVFPKTSACIQDVGTRQGVLRPLGMTKREGIICARLSVPWGRGGGGRGWRKGRGGSPGESHGGVVVVKYVILFAVVKMWCLMVMVSIVLRAIMGIVTVMLVAWVPVAVVCISVCVIKQCVSTTKGKRKRKGNN